ncbi:hypothetical protein CBR_g49339 [Chara braunii]|uniref:Uncharacterized protein n=1 Tax=Chara braunii TaxID=69332 RepID=A0A388M4Q5_CHABU|nr:hypothetical protein CBR_g49339 [Chara braunii]|eukprot:GBG89550.1 hypothetical protein CBR_g49339 [Chara braunii]
MGPNYEANDTPSTSRIGLNYEANDTPSTSRIGLNYEANDTPSSSRMGLNYEANDTPSSSRMGLDYEVRPLLGFAMVVMCSRYMWRLILESNVLVSQRQGGAKVESWDIN